MRGRGKGIVEGRGVIQTLEMLCSACEMNVCCSKSEMKGLDRKSFIRHLQVNNKTGE